MTNILKWAAAIILPLFVLGMIVGAVLYFPTLVKGLVLLVTVLVVSAGYFMIVCHIKEKLDE